MTHDAYNKAIREEIDKFLAGKDSIKFTSADAPQFLKQIKNSKNAIIQAFNSAVQEEADAAFEAGEKAYRKAIANGFNSDKAYELGKEEANRAARQTRQAINDAAAKIAKNAGGGLKNKARKALPGPLGILFGCGFFAENM